MLIDLAAIGSAMPVVYTGDGLVASLIKNATQRIHKYKKQHHWKLLHKLPPSLFYDRDASYKCFTNFEPRHVLANSLQSLRYAAPAATNASGADGWQLVPDVAIAKPDILTRARKQGYLDFKFSYVGNNASGPIHFKVF